MQSECQSSEARSDVSEIALLFAEKEGKRWLKRTEFIVAYARPEAGEELSFNSLKFKAAHKLPIST